MSERQVRVAAVQLTSGTDVAANIDRAIEGIERAVREGATYVQLPEYTNFRGPSTDVEAVAESIPGPTTARFAALATRHAVTIHVGSLVERSSDRTKTHNTSVLIAANGDVVATYRKAHLFDVNVPGEIEYLESRRVVASDALVVAEVGDFTLGLSICFDLRFAELYRALCVRGATVLAVPSSFAVATGKVHWEVLLRARAIENHAFVIAAAQAGVTHEGISSYGHSMIIGPWGEVLATSMLPGDDVLVATIDLDDVRQRRQQIDVLNLRRVELYGDVLDATRGRGD